MSKLARDHRNTDLAKIHMAKSALGMSRDEYQAMLRAQTGMDSASALDHAGRLKVLSYLQQLGWKPRASASGKRPKRPQPAADKLRLVRRIRAQLISLDRKPDEYADGIARQMFGQVEFFEWCDHDQLHKISAALGVEQRRKGAATR